MSGLAGYWRRLLAGILPRLSLWFVVLAFLPALGLTWLTDQLSSAALFEKTRSQLLQMALNKAERVETYAFERTRGASIMGHTRRIADAVIGLQSYVGDPQRIAKERHALEAQVLPMINTFLDTLGFTNAIVLSADGDVLLQTRELLDLGANVLQGPQRDSPLGRVVSRASTLLEADISDFAVYPGSAQPIGFMATPVFDDRLGERNSRIVGILALQLDTEEIYRLFTDRKGMGKTGQAVVGMLQRDQVRLVAPLRENPNAAFNLTVPMGGAVGQGIQRGVVGDRGFGRMRSIDDREVLAAWTYLPSFRWGLAVNMDEDEAMALVHDQRRATLIVMGLILLPTMLAAFLVARSISQPIAEAVHAAQTVANGDLTVRTEGRSDTETGKLLRALGRMTSYLNSLVGQVQKSTIDLVSTANSLSAMTHAQGEEAASLRATTNQIAAASKEISATAEELVRTMSEVTRVANDTAELARTGRIELGEMEQVMGSLVDATGSISGKLNAISERASDIGGVTTTISKIADQTNLLSLNAAIEAEKAGEYGRGFGVVAREIRRLADQTAVATLDIERMVKEMQSAVSGGVMEMDKFSESVRRGVEETNEINAQFARIIEQVETLLPRFDSVHEGMQSQAAGANQIRDAMVALTESAAASVEALEQTNRATQQLESAIAELRQEISIFKLS
jgi:methyl-accepting chemotaxis protein WspA